MELTCECGHRLKLWPELVGQQTRCPKCRGSFIVRPDRLESVGRVVAPAGPLPYTAVVPNEVAKEPGELGFFQEVRSYVRNKPGEAFANLAMLSVIALVVGVVVSTYSFRADQLDRDHQWLLTKALFALGFGSTYVAAYLVYKYPFFRMLGMFFLAAPTLAVYGVGALANPLILLHPVVLGMVIVAAVMFVVSVTYFAAFAVWSVTGEWPEWGIEDDSDAENTTAP